MSELVGPKDFWRHSRIQKEDEGLELGQNCILKLLDGII